jgi:hypothetical protein
MRPMMAMTMVVVAMLGMAERLPVPMHFKRLAGSRGLGHGSLRRANRSGLDGLGSDDGGRGEPANQRCEESATIQHGYLLVIMRPGTPT